MRRSIADVIAQLRAEGLVADADIGAVRAALGAEPGDDAPWYLRVAIGLGAWLATALLLGFFMTVAPLDDDVTRMLTGAVLTAAAVAVHLRSPADFMRHATVAASLAGQFLFLAGFHDTFDERRLTGLMLVVLSGAMVWLVPDTVHRFLSAVAFGVGAFVATVDEKTMRGFEAMTLVMVAITAIVWRARLRERSADVARMLVPVGYGLVTIIFGALLMGLLTRIGRLSLDDTPMFVLGRVTTAGITVALLALAWKILDEQGRARGPVLVATMVAIIGIAVITMSTPGIIAAAAVLTLSFDRGDRVLRGMGILFLLVFASAYYYTLALTLLEKSAVLALSGAVLLAIRSQVQRA